MTFAVDALRRRLIDDDVLTAEVIQLFLNDLPETLSAISAALRQDNASALCAAAHTLRGAAASVSAERLSDTAQQLEDLGADSRMAAADIAWPQLSSEAANVITAMRAYSANRSPGGAAAPDPWVDVTADRR